MRWNTFKLIAAGLIGIGALGGAGGLLWAQQPSGRLPPGRPARAVPAAPGAARPQRLEPRYTVDPPDLIVVDVLEALPGRPLSGERLVRPDGTISLGYYGDVQVAGLTVPEIKVKVIEHMRKFLNDDVLGLVYSDEDGKVTHVAPLDSNRVSVDVTAYNSKVYYVEGEVKNPGRLPVTGKDSVLDAIHYCDNLTPRAAPDKIYLVRPGASGAQAQVLKVDYAQITTGTDHSTNYQLRPGDRVVVPRNPAAKDEPTDEAASAAELRAVENRLKEVEAKLDRILQSVEGNQKKNE